MLPKPAIPQNILSEMLEAVDDVSTKCRATLTGLYAQQTVTCQKGCGACCHFPLISATSAEAFVLYHILMEAVEDKESLRIRFLSYAKRYLDFALKQGSLPFTDAQQREAFLSLKLPCPLFRSQGENMAGYCSIFSTRPLICEYFHSLESPALCSDKRPHSTSSVIIATGATGVDELQTREIALIGRSALGHLPLLLAAFATEEGLRTYLSSEFRDDETEALPEPQRDAAYGFGLYMELLAALGYQFTEKDINALIEAQDELSRSADEPRE